MIGHGGLLRVFSNKGFWVCLGDVQTSSDSGFFLSKHGSAILVSDSPILTEAEGNSIHPT